MPDILPLDPAASSGPALSATSDMPSIEAPRIEAKAEPKQDRTPDAKTQAEADKAAEKTPDAVAGSGGDAVSAPGADADVEHTEADPAPAEKPVDKPDPAVTERALKGEVTKEKNRRQAAERKAQEAEERLTLALKAIEKPAAPKTEPAADPRPQPTAFESPAAYDTALEAWATRQGAEAGRLEAKKAFDEQQAEKDRTDTAARQEREQQAVITTWQERVKKIEADIPDLVEVVTASEVPMSPVMQAALYKAENGPAIAYHLAKNPDEATRINALPTQLEQLMAMGELAQQIKQARKPTASKAPPPIKQIGSKANAAPKSPDEMSGDEYYEWSMAKKNAARAAKH